LLLKTRPALYLYKAAKHRISRRLLQRVSSGKKTLPR